MQPGQNVKMQPTGMGVFLAPGSFWHRASAWIFLAPGSFWHLFYIMCNLKIFIAVNANLLIKNVFVFGNEI
jgi:hypothetical protein